ncbi:hypothetical protein GCM10025866_19680 [Naasia aerilata]|uniref:FAD/NAD(P)-binding domain-containing protein n=1 Tax=Naasia aerilata TaxID=1162966 RepID=A0ABN6XMD2_9MICO|nr:FAD-dependent oxidoreductase [Naasia aerilata]BDZ46059.1 hypothetical protein GCM10025866_19680 [Naasia aerilata]
MASGEETRPAILVAGVSEGMRADVLRELERRYAADYRILSVATPEAADRLRELAAKGERLALLLADDPQPGSSPTSVFAAARRLFPEGRRGRLIEWGGWADPDVTRTVLAAMGEGLIEYYVLRPGPSPDESFHRSVIEFLLEWMRTVGGRRDLTLVGEDTQPRTHQLRSLVARSGVSSRYVDPSTEAGRAVLAAEHLEYAGVPLVRLGDGRVLSDPTNTELFAAYGLSTELPAEQPVDVAIVGAGPGGLAAAVYAASEGLATLVLERDAVGGQAGSSSLIRNYLGFSRGVSGTELAQRAYQQAWVFGARFAQTREVTGMTIGDVFRLRVDGGEELRARTVVLATGVSYRRLDLGSLSPFVGASVFYGASAVEARGQAGRTVHVIGGGNSAGQAALHLARYAADVSIVVRGRDSPRACRAT